MTDAQSHDAAAVAGTAPEVISVKPHWKFGRLLRSWRILYVLAAVCYAGWLGTHAPHWVVVLFATVLVAGMLRLALIMRQLRHVALTSTSLLIWDTGSRTEVPLGLITEVHEKRRKLLGRRRIQVTFGPGAAVSKVIFLPIGRSPSGFTAEKRLHPTTRRLQRLITSNLPHDTAPPIALP